MQIYKTEVTINKKKYRALVDSFGEGDIPIIISGHAEVYAELLKKAFSGSDLLKKYKFFVPKLYWCKDAPLSNLSDDVLDTLTFDDLVGHLEEIRQCLEEQNLLEATQGKIGIYSHSAFSALAFYYAAKFPKGALFIETEGPPPYLTAEWSKEKGLFFSANASKVRKEALAKHGISPTDSAVDEKSMDKFTSFRDAYHKMNPTLWHDFNTDHRTQIWGDKELNMPMMKRYFRFLSSYDSRHITQQVKCPVHISMGLLDTAVPPYLWIDKRKDGGIGFFEEKRRDYRLFTESGHWPVTEQPQEYCTAFDNFVNEHVVIEPLRAKL